MLCRQHAFLDANVLDYLLTQRHSVSAFPKVYHVGV